MKIKFQLTNLTTGKTIFYWQDTKQKKEAGSKGGKSTAKNRRAKLSTPPVDSI